MFKKQVKKYKKKMKLKAKPMFFSRQNTRVSTYVIKVEAEMSISKDNLIYGVISRILTLQNALCRCTYVLD